MKDILLTIRQVVCPMLSRDALDTTLEVGWVHCLAVTSGAIGVSCRASRVRYAMLNAFLKDTTGSACCAWRRLCGSIRKAKNTI